MAVVYHSVAVAGDSTKLQNDEKVRVGVHISGENEATVDCIDYSRPKIFTWPENVNCYDIRLRIQMNFTCWPNICLSACFCFVNFKTCSKGSALE